MFYINTDKTISATDKSISHMVKMPMKGIYKYWFFWAGLLLIVFLFIWGSSWAVGHYILGR